MQWRVKTALMTLTNCWFRKHDLTIWSDLCDNVLKMKKIFKDIISSFKNGIICFSMKAYVVLLPLWNWERRNGWYSLSKRYKTSLWSFQSELIFALISHIFFKEHSTYSETKMKWLIVKRIFCSVLKFYI